MFAFLRVRKGIFISKSLTSGVYRYNGKILKRLEISKKGRFALFGMFFRPVGIWSKCNPARLYYRASLCYSNLDYRYFESKGCCDEISNCPLVCVQ